MDRMTSARHVVRKQRISKMAAARGLTARASDGMSRATTARATTGRALQSRAITARATASRGSRIKSRTQLPSLDISHDSPLLEPRDMSPYDVIPPVRRRPSTAGNTSSEINDAIAELRKKHTIQPILKNGESHPYPYFVSDEVILTPDEPRPRSAPGRTYHNNLWRNTKKACEKFRMDNKFAKSFIAEYILDAYIEEAAEDAVNDFMCEPSSTPAPLIIKKRPRAELTDDQITGYVSEDLFQDLLETCVQKALWRHVDDISEQITQEHYDKMTEQMEDKLALYEDQKAALLLHQVALLESDTIREGTHRILKDISMAAAVYHWFRLKRMSSTMQNFGFKVIHNKINNNVSVGILERNYLKEMNKHLDMLDSKEIQSTPPR